MADEWWRGATIYQIYPRSFQDSDGDGIGDLPGIASRLDYVKALGVDGVWLSPFFTSPMRDFGYDVSDYRGVDPMFGTMADFDALLAAAHERGLKVIIDQVWSHSSSDHEWFEASRQDRTNDKAEWYVWADPKPDGAPPNNWQAWFGGPAWTWEPRRRQYYLHNFLPSQPDLNLRNPQVHEAIKDVARFWLDKGVDGFRLDVVNYYIHDDRLRDNPPSGRPEPALPRDMQEHAFNSNQPETLDFVAELRALTDSYGDRMMVGEIAPGSFDLMRDYTRTQQRLHTAYAFDLLGDWHGAERLGEIIARWADGLEEGWPGWALSNHDVARIATRWSAAIGASEPRTAVLCLAFLTTLRGTIFIYQGEELGLPQADVPFDRLQDPWGIAGWPQNKGRDGCRTPMPWNASTDGGFSHGSPWLPIADTHLALAADVQDGQPQSVLAIARVLVSLRRMFPALRTGALSLVPQTTPGVLAFMRGSGEEAFLCAFNFSAASVAIETGLDERLDRVFGAGQARDGRVSVPAHGVYIGRRPAAGLREPAGDGERLLAEAAALPLAD